MRPRASWLPPTLSRPPGSPLLPRRPAPRGGGIAQSVAGTCTKVEAIDALQLRDLLQRGRLERALPLEGVQHDAFDQVAERHIVELSQSLQHLEDPLLKADACLHAIHHDPRLGQHDLPRPTNIPWYQGTKVCARE